MLPGTATASRKPDMVPSSMARGLAVLKSMTSRPEFQMPTWKLRPRQQSLSQHAQALSRYYRKMSEAVSQDTRPQDSGFLYQVGRLQRAFLARPGCPQLTSRATSMSHCGLPALADLPEEDEDLKCASTTKAWVSWEKARRSDSAELPRPVSQSACELSYLRRSSSGSLSPGSSGPGLEQRAARKRTPWYITVIRDKEYCLTRLEEQLRRLSRLEAQLQKRDKEIRELRELQEELRKQLRGRAEDSGLRLQTQEDGSRALQDEEGRGLEPEAAIFTEREGLEAEADLDGGSRASSVLAQEEELCEEEAEVLELEEEEEAERELQDARTALGLDATFQDELMGQLQELEQVMQEFQLELEVTRNNYSMATGAITTLLRQVEYQESQLRKVNMENEKLEKELRERKNQLLAMSEKFSNLREEKKQVEMLGQTEKENLLLRQQVSMLEEQLAARDKAIAELSSEATGLRGLVEEQRGQLQRWGQLQQEQQAKVEDVRQDEQQTRVALESTQARLERLRNSIMQATFSSTSLSKAMTTEITDSDILETLQVIISERSEHLGQLKQKGAKLSPVGQSESATKSKKPTSK